MNHLFLNKKMAAGLFLVLLLFLSGCSNFAGIRAPLYDGQPVEPDEEAIEQYAKTQQINKENEGHYFRYPLSETLSEPSLDFSHDEETVLLEAGTYIVGDDLPAGRVVLEGHPSNYSPEVFLIYAGNLTIYDVNDGVAFENHFQERSGVMRAMIDLREGQRIEVEGEDPRINVLYSEDAAETLPQVDDADRVMLMAGHYEVGEHLDAGTYAIESVAAPRTPVLYHFTDGEIDVVELTRNRGVIPRVTEEENEEWFEVGRLSKEEYERNLALFDDAPDKPTIELSTGDKLYLPMLDLLELEKQ